jgi:tetratricopeptide (TPR) repeat protein
VRIGRAHRSDPELPAQLEEAGRFIREGRPERVSEVLARLRALAPKHPQLAKLEAQAQKVLGARDVRVRVRGLVDQARKLHIRGDLEKALELAEEAVQLTPDDAWALRLRDDLMEQLQKTRRLQGKPPV